MLHVFPKLYLLFSISLSKALMYVVINYQKGEIESTSAPWVILVINVNISLVGLILLPSMFQISSTMEWHGLEDVEPLQDPKDKGLAQDQSTRLYILLLVIQDHIESIGKPILLRLCLVGLLEPSYGFSKLQSNQRGKMRSRSCKIYSFPAV